MFKLVNAHRTHTSAIFLTVVANPAARTVTFLIGVCNIPITTIFTENHLEKRPTLGIHHYINRFTSGQEDDTHCVFMSIKLELSNGQPTSSFRQ